MKRTQVAASLIAAAFIGGLATPGQAQQSQNVRGTIQAFDGKTLTVETFDGRKLVIDAPADLRVATTKPFSLSEVKPGMKLGVVTVKRPSDGATVAIDVRPVSATASEGLAPYDLKPDSVMTNAVVEEATVAASAPAALTLNYKTGTVKVIVPPEATLSQSGPGSLADLKPGETIFVVVAQKGDKLTAQRAQVSKDGVKPTQ
jgi:hypothetical protein